MRTMQNRAVSDFHLLLEENPLLQGDVMEEASESFSGDDAEWDAYRPLLAAMVSERQTLLTALRSSDLSPGSCTADMHRTAALHGFTYENARWWVDLLRDTEPQEEACTCGHRCSPGCHSLITSPAHMGMRPSSRGDA